MKLIKPSGAFLRYALQLIPTTMRPTLFCFILFGTALWVYACFMPALKNGKSYDDLYAVYEQQSSNEGMKTAYYEAEKTLRTDRNPLLDGSSGLVVGSITLLLFLKVTGIRKPSQLRQLQTIRKLCFFVWLNVGWVVLFAALYWYYMYRGARSDFPPFADSIGIPLWYGQTALVTCWPVVNGVFLLAIWPAKLPANLLERPERYTLRSVIVEIIIGFALLLLGLYTVVLILDGDHLTIPVALLFIYLLLVVRAGHMRAVSQK